MDYDNIILERSEGIATITMNRPKALNALNSATLLELACAIDEIRADDSLRAVIITGAGEKAFVAGADIAEMVDLTPGEAMEFSRLGHQTMDAIEALPLPVIAAVNGFALGGGCELALACDFIYAAERARFGQPEVNLGIMAGFGGTVRLPRRVGPARAKEMLLSGEMIDAQTAERWGLANRVYPADSLLGAARTMAATIAAKGPVAVSITKRTAAQGLDADRRTARELEQNAFALTFTTEDRKEGLAAFLEKRKAAFTGR